MADKGRVLLGYWQRLSMRERGLDAPAPDEGVPVHVVVEVAGEVRPGH